MNIQTHKCAGKWSPGPTLSEHRLHPNNGRIIEVNNRWLILSTKDTETLEILDTESIVPTWKRHHLGINQCYGPTLMGAKSVQFLLISGGTEK
jgi:hypothetical protein